MSHPASGIAASNIMDRRAVNVGDSVEFRINPIGSEWVEATIVAVEVFSPATGEHHSVDWAYDFEEGDEVHLVVFTVALASDTKNHWGYWSQVRIP